MPNCFVKNCKSRTGYIFNKSVKYYSFPRDPELRSKWLAACQRDENYKVTHERICEIHFLSECFEHKTTKPRSTHVTPKVVNKLKKRSVPTELLHLPNKRQKLLHSFGNTSDNQDAEPSKKFVCCAKPTYSELVNCKTKSEEDTILESIDNTESTISTTLCTTNASVVEENSSMESSDYKKLLAAFKKLQEENEQLLQNNLQLQSMLQEKCQVIETIQKDMKECGQQIANDILHTIFTPGQVKRLMSKNSKMKWTIDDITSAIALRCISGRAYKYYREVLNIPLPCVSTLRNWVADFKVKPGILKEVLQIMEVKRRNMTTAEKLAVLTFDEVYIANKIDLERREQRIYGPHKTCQVVIARGLFSNWKQPIYYDYSKSMTKKTLFDIIKGLYEIGYTVVATTSDMGSTNMALWKELNIGIKTKPTSWEKKQKQNEHAQKQCFFEHPSESSLKVFVFADVPHLIKLIRNNFFDSGFTFNGETFDKSLLEELLQLNNNDLKIAFNLSKAHLDVKGFQRQRVLLAAQIFSMRNAKALEYCGNKGFLTNSNWQAMSNMIKTINNWFDVLNSQTRFGKHNGLHAYGIDLDNQNKILEEMNNFILKLRVATKSHLMPFQKGILVTNTSLQQLLPYLKERYSTETFQPQYIITRRLCQDVLENFFSYVRAMGAANTHPSPVEFKNRLKWYILSKHSAHAISVKANTEIDDASEPFVKLRDYNSEREAKIFDENEEEEFTTETALFLGNSNFKENCANDEDDTDIPMHVDDDEEGEEFDFDNGLINLKLFLLHSYN